MKAVLFSIKPKYCKMIFNREKGIEVRVRIPNLKPPYKAYAYCTKEELWTKELDIMDGHVIGEFEVDAVEPMIKDSLVQGERFVPGWKQRLSCLTEKEILDYAKNRQAYGLFIKNAFLFEEPKELTAFRRWSDEVPCVGGKFCEHQYFDYSEGTTACSIDFDGADCVKLVLSRPPQSWCYVEVIP